MAEINSIVIPYRVKDLTGQVFGRLLVQRYVGSDRCGHARWHCQCSCGATCTPLGTSLVTGKTLSCGCLNRDNAAKIMTVHGLSHHAEHAVWCKMLARCYCVTDKSYRHYGGRGIAVCNMWRASFVAFFADMGCRPSPEHSIDRINNDGNYEPSNCRWATATEQACNTRRTRLLTLNDRTMCLTHWSKEIGLTPNAIRYRLSLGWSDERILTEPRRHRHLPDSTTPSVQPS